MLATLTAILILAAAPSDLAAQAARTPVPQSPAPGQAGGAAGQLFIFTYRPGPAWRPGAPMSEQGLGPHGAYQRSLVEQGRSFAAGPFLTSEGGMTIIRAADLDEARALLAADPAVKAGIFTASIEAWRPRFRTAQPLPQTR